MDKPTSKEKALVEIYRVMRPGEPPTVETAEKLFYDMFLSPAKMGFAEVEARLDPDPRAKVVASLVKTDVDGLAWVMDVANGWVKLVVSGGDSRGGLTGGTYWVKETDVLIQPSERYDLSAVGRVKMNSRLCSWKPRIMCAAWGAGHFRRGENPGSSEGWQGRH